MRIIICSGFICSARTRMFARGFCPMEILLVIELISTPLAVRFSRPFPSVRYFHLCTIADLLTETRMYTHGTARRERRGTDGRVVVSGQHQFPLIDGHRSNTTFGTTVRGRGGSRRVSYRHNNMRFLMPVRELCYYYYNIPFWTLITLKAYWIFSIEGLVRTV